jgi:integrase/recombinase XerC/integrase/recombinase XerD
MNSVIVTESEIIKGSYNDIQSLKEAFLNSQNVRESSRKLYGRTLKQFFLWVAKENKSFPELTRIDIIQYLEYLENSLKLSSLTIGSYLITVRKFFEWTEAVKLYPNIAKGIKAPRRSQTFEKGYLSDEKSKALLNYFESLSLRDYAIVNLMLRTGLRTIEVARATIGDICYIGEKRVLKVWGKGKSESEKGKDFNFVVLTEKSFLPIYNYLEASRRGAKSGEPLFTSFSHRNHGKGITTRTVSGICKDGLKAIGLDGKEYTAHSLRHTTACSLLEHGRNLTEVQHVLRHSSPNTTQIYTKMKEREIRLKEAPEAALDMAF